MIITKEWLEEHEACSSGYEWFLHYTGETEHEALTQALMADNEHGYANWLVANLMTHKQQIQYSVFAAELAEPMWDKEYPDNKVVRDCIDAAKKCIDNPAKENKEAARAAADAAWAAAEAARAAGTAAYKKIIEYGLELLRKGEY